MAGMSKQQTWLLIGLVAIGVIGGLYMLNSFKQAGIGAQTAPVGGQEGINQLPQCGNQMPVAQLLTYYNDPNNNNLYTKVSTTAGLYIAGSPTASASTTTSASGITVTGSGNLSCGVTYREIAGDGSTYYYSRTADFVVNNAVMPPPNGGKGLLMVPSGAAIPYIKNASGLYASTTTFNWTGAGKTNSSTDDTDLMVKIQAPSTPAMFGDLGYALCFRYNSGNFSKVSALGGTTVNVAHYKATGALDTISCYEFEALPLGSTKEIQLSLKAASGGPSPTTLANTTIDMALVDKTNELYNGYLIPDENAAAGVLGNGYDTINDPGTGTGRADVTQTSLITILRTP